jgi:signal transduction histidine kinase
LELIFDRGMRERPSLTCALLIAVAIQALGLVGLARADDRQKQVLVLYSTRRDAQIAVLGERDLPPLLDAAVPEGVDYYSEYLDQVRFTQPDYQAAFRDFLKRKYRPQRFDLVVAMGDLPLEFVEKNRDVVFDGSPVVFYSNGPVRRGLKNATGIVVRLNFAGTLSLATRAQPEVRQVFVVTGAADGDRAYEDTARAQFRGFEPRLSFTYLSGWPTRDLEKRLGSLPQHSIVYYLVVNRDGAGENFHPLEYAERVSAAANAPTYSWIDSTINRGVVGGNLKDLQRQTHAVGELAARVLRGERADSIPISAPDLNEDEVDWRQLRRWGIDERRLPKGTIVRFREPSTWDRYKFYIVGAITVVLAQSVLIAGLLVQRARRRQAEAQVRGGQAELQKSYERIHDLGARLLNAQEGERARIARDLHDDVSQQMALLEIDLELLGRAVPTSEEELADEALRRARDIAKTVHDLSHRLHPAKLRLIGLVAALNGLQRELSQADLRITFTHDSVPSAIASEVTLCVFRVVQEALQNAVKYSRAQEVSVHLAGDQGSLILNISDDGVGFEVEKVWGKGLGLISISERLDAIGGTVRIHSSPGAGTRLDVTIPLRAGDAAEPVAV